MDGVSLDYVIHVLDHGVFGIQLWISLILFFDDPHHVCFGVYLLQAGEEKPEGIVCQSWDCHFLYALYGICFHFQTGI